MDDDAVSTDSAEPGILPREPAVATPTDRLPPPAAWVAPAGCLLALLAGIAIVVVGFVVYDAGQHPGTYPSLQLVGSADRARQIVEGAGGPGRFQDAVAADNLLVLLYITGLVLLLLTTAATVVGRNARVAVFVAAIGAVLAGALDWFENIAVAHGLAGLSGRGDAPWAVAAALDVAKWTLLIPVAAIALVGTATVARRAGRALWILLRAPLTCRVERETHPRHPGQLPAAMLESRPPGRTAVCVSGGGIRSATVALGALQQLRPRWLDSDGYLFSVSGGGYFSGALRLAMQDERPHRPPPDFELGATYDPTLFAEGEPELGYLRRHGRYIADTAGQWVVALGSVLTHLLYSLALIAAVAVALGLALGSLFHALPLVGPGSWATFPPAFRPPVPGQPPPLQPIPWFNDPLAPRSTVGPFWAVIVLLALAVLCVLVAGGVRAARGRPTTWLERAAQGAVALAALAVVTTTLVPVAVATLALQEWFPDDAATAGATGGIGALLTTLATAIATLAAKRIPAGGPATRAGLVGAVVLRAIVVVVVLALVVGALVVLASTAHAVVTLGWQDPSVWGPAIGVGVAALAAMLLDQTQASLHPFYRRRMASAFALRRTEPHGAEEYPWTEETDLPTYGRKVPGHPHVVFVASAQRSRGAGTSPGRGASPFSFAADWVGGPEVGYVETSAYRSRAPRAYQADLTVLGAMAISGAAIASAMGRSAAPFQVLLALSNARLGAWLPHPRWLEEEAATPYRWNRRGLPRWRRETYHAREILGRYPDDDPLVLVTDGGHYDNLALVEALRHRCSSIIVVDAGADTPDFPSDLITAIELARDALGVTVRIDRDALETLRPGTGYPAGSTNPLAARTSAKCSLVGTITYPDAPEQGTLVVVKSRLTPGMPTAVAAYAMSHPSFPHDSTADQWFDHDQFEAYRQLGRFLGSQADAALP